MVLLSFAFQYQMKIIAGEVAPILSRAGGVIDKAHSLMHGPAAWRLLENVHAIEHESSLAAVTLSCDPAR